MFGKRKGFFAVGLAVGILAAGVAPVTAASPVYGNTMLVSRNADGSSVVLTAAPGTTSKTATPQGYNNALAAGWVSRVSTVSPSTVSAGTVTPQSVGYVGTSTCSSAWAVFTLSQGSCQLSAYTYDYETPPGGSRSAIETGYTSSIHRNYGVTGTNDVYFDRSDSWTTWLGVNPWNASEVCLRDEWDTTGWAFTGVSVTVPGGLSGGFTSSGNSLFWTCPTTLSNAYSMEHITSGVHFNGFNINGLQETASEDMRFGSTWYTSYNATKGIH